MQRRVASEHYLLLYTVFLEGEGDRGGAPVLCMEGAAVLCSKWGEATEEWSPLVVLVPLVLGLDKLHPRYLPSLRATFTFPQSLGVAGGKPGTSTYLIGVQDDQAMYLDPHENQQVFAVTSENLELDTSTYHCSVVRRLPLDSIDPSLAIGFYCRNRELVKQSNGAPIFTVAKKSAPSKLQNSSDLGRKNQFLKTLHLKTTDKCFDGNVGVVPSLDPLCHPLFYVVFQDRMV